jgi:choline dehydrogenase-like flavoprotein
MNAGENSAQDLAAQDWDVIVIGTGMGGASAGFGLAQKGRKVLFLEKGRKEHGHLHLRGKEHEDPNAPENRLLTGRWPFAMQGRTSFGPMSFFGPMGCGAGGTTALYGAQLERFFPSDFTPAQNFPGGGRSTLPQRWPFSYEQLLPYYQQAETLLDLCGTPDPLQPGQATQMRPPPDLSARDQALWSLFENKGLSPYRSHVGYHKRPDCWECLDQCYRACKSDAARCFLHPALTLPNARLLTDCEVQTLEPQGRRIAKVHALCKGERLTFQGKTVVLAAGAFLSPTLLMRSGGVANGSGQVGRNLMLHTSDILLLESGADLDASGPAKSISFNDFYQTQGQKLGAVQSLGLRLSWPFILAYLRHLDDKASLPWRRALRPWLEPLAKRAEARFANASAFTTIVEDLPYAENRVLPADNGGGFRFDYTVHRELRQRTRALRRMVRGTLSPEVSVFVATGTRNRLNFGHACGTLRAGDDPATSVLDGSNRAHELDNLYVSDASFFPSSGGTNPSLTIAANGLRVAEIIDRRL